MLVYTIISIIMQEEIWKSVIGFDQYYEVSNLGNVRRHIQDTSCKNTFAGRPKKFTLSDRGYYRVMLSNGVAGSNRYFPVHELVAEAFIGFRPTTDHEINHIDGNKINNNVINLEWITHSSNLKHAVDLGIKTRHSGIAKICMKLTVKDILDIRNLYKQGKTQKELASLFNISKMTVRGILLGTSWRHITKGENILETHREYKFDTKIILAIRNDLRISNLSQNEIAEKYGVSPMTVCNLKYNRIWKHIK